MKKLILPEESGLRHRMQDLEYIQQGVLMFQASSVMQHLPSDFSGIVILEGCQISKTGVGSPYTYNLSKGIVFYKPATAPTSLVDVDPLGEILEVEAQTIVSATEPQWELHQVSEATGLRVFRSGEQYDVCLEFKMRLKTGSGLAQWNEVRRLEHIQFNKSKELFEMITLLKMPHDDFFTDFFDEDGNGLAYKKYEGFAICTDSATGAVDMGGIVSVGINFKDTALSDVRQQSSDGGSTNATTYYKKTGTWAGLVGTLVGKWKHLLLSTEAAQKALSTTLSTPDDTGLQTPSIGPGTGIFGVGSTSNKTISFPASDAANAHNILQPSRMAIKIMKVEEITF
jgi:hypothetical protein